MVSFSKIAALTTVVGVAARPLRNNNGAGKVTQESSLGASNTIPSDGTRYDTLSAVVQAKIGGEQQNLKLIGDSGCKVPPYDAPNYGTPCIHTETEGSSELTVQNVTRAYFADEAGDAYYLFKMQNNETKTVSFDVNYQGSSCGTNATVYLVDMLSQDGKYCDANYKGYNGEACAEIDLTEGNQNAQQFTSHYCSGTTSNCNTSGDYARSGQYFSPVDPTPSGGIDTRNSFNVSVTFEMGSDSLTKLTQTITQGGNKVTNELSGDLNVNSQNIYDSLVSRGMVFTIAFWSGDQTWMENDSCGSQDPSIGNMQDLKWTLDNFTIVTKNA